MDNGQEYYRRFLDGDESGLCALIETYKDGLIFYLRGITGDYHTAEDLAEETFVRLLIRKPRDRGTGSFKTWLYTIGRNIALNDRRNRRPFGELPEEAADDVALEELCLREERKRLVYRAIQRLQPAYRQVLWLTYFEGFSNREVGQIMKKSTHAVETLAYRARGALKTALEQEGYTDEEYR